MSKMSDLDLKIKTSPTLRRGLSTLADFNMPLDTVFTNPMGVLRLPGISTKTLQCLEDHALAVGVVHPLVKLVQQLLKDEWESGANNQPGWHMEPNQLIQLSRRLEKFL
jgi:hypothetical protein